MLVYAGIANAGLAWALASNSADAAGYVAIAVFVSVAVGVLPLAAGMLQEGGARFVMSFPLDPMADYQASPPATPTSQTNP